MSAVSVAEPLALSAFPCEITGCGLALDFADEAGATVAEDAAGSVGSGTRAGAVAEIADAVV